MTKRKSLKDRIALALVPPRERERIYWMGYNDGLQTQMRNAYELGYQKGDAQGFADGYQIAMQKENADDTTA